MERQIFLKNNSAFTLLELLVALFITMVSLLALLTSINLAISSNLNNELHQQAVGLGEDTLNEIKKLPFDNITANWAGEPRPLFLRGTRRQYLITKNITTFTDTKRVDVGVSWSNRGNNFEHTVATLVTRTIGATE